MNRQEFNNELEMLKGNIGRICLTKDIKELEDSLNWAIKRLENIIKYRMTEINK